MEEDDGDDDDDDLLTIAAVTKFLRKILCYTDVEMITLKCILGRWGVKCGIY